MNINAKLKKFITDPGYRLIVLFRKFTLKTMNDKDYLSKLYRYRMGKDINWEHPATYTEKLQWLKINDRKSIYTTMVDKYEVKAYVAKIIGEEYIIPALGVWDSFDEIDFDKLPDQFVLKCTHDSGGLVICRDKIKFNKKTAKAKLERSLNRNYFWRTGEWPYFNVKPRIIAEEYIEDSATKELRDYKFFCFNGVPRAVLIATERQNPGAETKFDFFDMNFQHLPFTNGHPNAEILPDKPEQFELMKRLAAKLSKDIPHLRVDFYEANGKVLFGELTFSHWSGLMPFVPEKWDEIFGSWIELNESN